MDKSFRFIDGCLILNLQRCKLSNKNRFLKESDYFGVDFINTSIYYSRYTTS